MIVRRRPHQGRLAGGRRVADVAPCVSSNSATSGLPERGVVISTVFTLRQALRGVAPAASSISTSAGLAAGGERDGRRRARFAVFGRARGVSSSRSRSSPRAASERGVPSTAGVDVVQRRRSFEEGRPRRRSPPHGIEAHRRRRR